MRSGVDEEEILVKIDSGIFASDEIREVDIIPVGTLKLHSRQEPCILLRRDRRIPDDFGAYEPRVITKRHSRAVRIKCTL